MGVLRELAGVIIYIAFLASFVFMMNHIAAPDFNGDGNYYTYIVVAIVVFAALMTYWDRIFRDRVS